MCIGWHVEILKEEPPKTYPEPIFLSFRLINPMNRAVRLQSISSCFCAVRSFHIKLLTCYYV